MDKKTSSMEDTVKVRVSGQSGCRRNTVREGSLGACFGGCRHSDTVSCGQRSRSRHDSHQRLRRASALWADAPLEVYTSKKEVDVDMIRACVVVGRSKVQEHGRAGHTSSKCLHCDGGKAGAARASATASSLMLYSSAFLFTLSLILRRSGARSFGRLGSAKYIFRDKGCSGRCMFREHDLPGVQPCLLSAASGTNEARTTYEGRVAVCIL